MCKAAVWVLLAACSRTDEAPPRRQSAGVASARSSAAAVQAVPPPPASAGQTTGEPAPSASARRILHFGDSMVPLVGNYLKPVFERQGATYTLLSTHSSSTHTWATDERLDRALREHDPDLVLVSLGTNQLFEQELDKIATSVRAIVKKLEGRGCLWIAPPAWTKDFGFARILQGAAGHCRYFDSTKLKFTRQADGRHPDWSSSHRWASEVWRELGGTGSIGTSG